MPDTLYRLLEDVEIVGRTGGGGGRLPKVWRLEAEFDLLSAGGVVAPYVEFNVEEDFVVGTEPLVPLDPLPLLESVLLSVLKLALDRLRISFRKEGAIIHLRILLDKVLTFQLNRGSRKLYQKEAGRDK